MIKKIGYFLITIILLLALAGFAGVRWFNNLWFKERPNHLVVTSDSNPFPFQWAEQTFGDYFEPHAAILIPLKIGNLPHKFYLQFDTGAPSTILYGNTLKSVKASGVNIKEIIKDQRPYVENLDFSFGDSIINMKSIHILEDYGESFPKNDTISKISIGTIGTDFMDNRITMIDFKNKTIQFYSERPNWMNSLTNFKPFDFAGRRFMLPAIIDGNKLELFYDSGSSCFGLITSKNRYDKYTDKNVEEIKFNANRFGDPIPIHHKYTDKTIQIGSAHLDLQRISYVNKYAFIQKYLTPFTRIGGWLGNKPFTESVLILDTKKQEFLVVKDRIQN